VLGALGSLRLVRERASDAAAPATKVLAVSSLAVLFTLAMFLVFLRERVPAVFPARLQSNAPFEGGYRMLRGQVPFTGDFVMPGRGRSRFLIQVPFFALLGVNTNYAHLLALRSSRGERSRPRLLAVSCVKTACFRRRS
jgi:hypothetical protein